MSDELGVAFEQIAGRGRSAGAPEVVRRALDQFEAGAPKRRGRFAVAAVAATLVAVVGAVAVVESRVDDIRRMPVGGAVTGGVTNADVVTVLAVGSDRRPEVEGERADAVMLLRVNRGTGTASVLSLPRDLLVTDSQARLAETMAAEPAQLIQAVRSLTGVSVDHYVEFDFAGFAKVVDAVGGVRMHIADPVSDQLALLDLPAGCNRLDGVQALAFVRSRHLVTKTPNGSRVDPTGDLGRITRQQALILAAIEQVPAELDDPRTIGRVTDAVTESVRVDERFSLSEMIRFVRDWADHDHNVRLLTVPVVHASTADGAVVLRPDDKALPAVVAAFTSDEIAPAPTTPSASCG